MHALAADDALVPAPADTEAADQLVVVARGAPQDVAVVHHAELCPDLVGADALAGIRGIDAVSGRGEHVDGFEGQGA